MENNKTKTNEQLAMKVSWVSIAGNLVLTAFKLIAGFVANSGAMVSDAIHSASDIFSTFVVMAGVKMSNKESDAEHPYGHERMECVAAILLAVLLCGTGCGIGISGLQKIFGPNKAQLAVPGALALAAAVVSIASKEAMYWYTRAAAKKINSGALMADAWHHRSDALSSIGSFAGILGARMGFPVLDPVASVIICIFIIKASWDIFFDSVAKMTDRACDDQTVEAMRTIISAQQGVLGIDQLKTRLFGDKIYVDIEISADGTIALNDSHFIAQQVHDAVEQSFPLVKHCMVHVNPIFIDNGANSTDAVDIV
ncbi:MAG: cation diffusion facilitator family transporter [Angelakisella sp.]|nr:cation diffusion facilitator family transporter [Angelakisella sp.]